MIAAALCYSPDYANDGTLLMATAEDGLFRSEDEGHTWTAWNFGLLDHNMLSLAISPNFQTDQFVIAGTSSGIFISQSGGERMAGD